MALFTKQHLVSTKRIFEGNIINLRVDTLQIPEGKTVTREVVEHNGGVVIACQPNDDQVVLIKQHRYSIDYDLWELPAGRIEAGEPPLPAAQRELAEETGFKAKKWEVMPKLFTAPGFSNEILYFYKATDVEEVERNLDEDEEIEVVILPVREAFEMLLQSEFADSKTLAGLAVLLKP